MTLMIETTSTTEATPTTLTTTTPVLTKKPHADETLINTDDNDYAHTALEGLEEHGSQLAARLHDQESIKNRQTKGIVDDSNSNTTQEEGADAEEESPTLLMNREEKDVLPLKTKEEEDALALKIKEEEILALMRKVDGGRPEGQAYSGYSCTAMPKSTDLVLFCEDWTKIALMHR
ncbi:hypothetical protein EC991_003330 [Linnemannia zychae]|nr:hypothetical protein EC991_003330 [Linnemannia zychae]